MDEWDHIDDLEPEYPCPWCAADGPDLHSTWCSASGERCRFCLRPLGFDHRADCPLAGEDDDPGWVMVADLEADRDDLDRAWDDDEDDPIYQKWLRS